MARTIETKAKLALKDFGDGASVLKSPVDALVMARIFGFASSIIVRNMPQGGSYEGLKGSFRIDPTDETAAVRTAPVIYLPDAVQKMIADMMRDGDGKETGTSVQFVFDVSSTKGEGDKWSWSFKSVVGPEAFDPIAELLASVEAPPTEAPSAAANKGKGK